MAAEPSYCFQGARHGCVMGSPYAPARRGQSMSSLVRPARWGGLSPAAFDQLGVTRGPPRRRQHPFCRQRREYLRYSSGHGSPQRGCLTIQAESRDVRRPTSPCLDGFQCLVQRPVAGGVSIAGIHTCQRWIFSLTPPVYCLLTRRPPAQLLIEASEPPPSIRALKGYLRGM